MEAPYQAKQRIREKLPTPIEAGMAGISRQNAEAVIRKLNPILRGWGNYFRVGVSKETFSRLDSWMFRKECRWINYTHPNKGQQWKKKTYFGKKVEGRQDRWVFNGEEHYLLKLSWIPITRHQLVIYDYAPDNPDLAAYWEERNQKQAHILPHQRQREMAGRQKGKCLHCHDSLYNGEELHTHHIIPKSKGGKDTRENLELVHLYCHQQIHGK